MKTHLLQLGKRFFARIPRAVFVQVVMAFCLVVTCRAQSSEAPGPADVAADDPAVTMFPHSKTARWWVSGQDNILSQWHPSFAAGYSGPNSFRSQAEHATSNVATLFTGLQLTHTTEIFMHFEAAAGGGLSDALGLAGFTDLDVVRNPTLGTAPYIARGMIRQIIPLSSEMMEEERTPWYLATEVPVRRIELRFGKMGVNDFFDINDIGTDSHSQFMNWTVDNNGAYDYAADTRGYTVGLLAEYHERNWAFRFEEALMPKVANGIDLDWSLRRSRAENYELELRPKFSGARGSVIRLLSFVNHANMGVYRDAINNYLAGKTSRPEITNHPEQTTVKYGFSVNAQQEITHALRLYSRFGWNEGQHESYAYTEVDQTVQIGGDYAGDRWKRKLDKTGGVFVSNAIKADHQRYLALGGRGFLLGDGALTYGRETIFEYYYNTHVWRGLFAAFDLQHINDPGYNRDRGPVLVPGLRVHLEF
ncbi:MAG TPA: carbohydrate porin [Terriglobales bacterium]|nr:carbohydrate porin [Terriglobales bacterium]